MFSEFFRGWIVVELLQLTGASWVLCSGPEKFWKCFPRANVPVPFELLHFVLLGNLNHLLLKLFLLFSRRFSHLHTLHALYNFASALFFSVELIIFQNLSYCPFVLTQLCFSVISTIGTVLFWISDRRFDNCQTKPMKLKRRNAKMRNFELFKQHEKVDDTKKNN